MENNEQFENLKKTISELQEFVNKLWSERLDGKVSGTTQISAYLDGAQSLNNSLTLIDYDMENYDFANEFSGAVFTATKNGYYHISAKANVAAGSAGEVVTIAVKKNSSYVATNSQPCVGSTYNTVQISCDVYLTVGDTIGVYGAYSTGTLAMSTGIAESNVCIHSI